jgi:competence protein ComEC
VDERRRRAGGAVVIVGLLGLTVLGTAAPGDGRLALTVLDVGQGEALVVRSPSGRISLVDAGARFGGRFDVGERVVARFLWARGQRGVDRLVVSHAHADHVGGIGSLVRSFRIGEVWEGPAPQDDPGYLEMDHALAAASLSRRTVFRGVSALWDGVAVSVLAPPRPMRAPQEVRNADSVVLSLVLGKVRFLLTGDIGVETEAQLGAVRALVLKVPHHGSRTSSSASFVRATAPAVAIISAGASAFGHPDPEVISRYQAVGATVLRTARDGAVTVATDGSRLWVRSHRGGAERRIR